MRPKPSLRTELLLSLSLLVAMAILVGAATTRLAVAIAPERTVLLLSVLVPLEVGAFVVYGRHLLGRLVLRPLGRLVETADAVADGRLETRAPEAETLDFARLGERLNRMTDSLLDAHGQLVRNEKLVTVGRLAAGIAHEVGNPLGAAGTYLEVLRRRGAEAEVAAGIARELDRIDQIVRGLLDYARPQVEALASLDAAAVARSAYELLASQGVLKKVTASLEVDAVVPPARGRADQLTQVVVNLLLNAVDAAPGGRVVLGVHRWRFEPERVPQRRASDAVSAVWPRTGERRVSRASIDAGQEGVLLVVADSGPGVPEGDRNKVFEPFFTTKEPGLGTGLGLAIVARAVHDMGGVVWVERAREGGAAFKVFLPEAVA